MKQEKKRKKKITKGYQERKIKLETIMKIL